MKYLPIIALIYVVGFFGHAYVVQKTVYGDGIYYYSWLRSIVVDHDINFTNEYTHFGATSLPTAQGTPGNKYSIGPALLWFPGYLWAHLLIRGDGYSLPYQLVVGLTSVLYALFGFILLLRLIKNPLAIAAVALATHIFFYGSLDTVNTHALTFFVVTVLLNVSSQSFYSGLFVGILGLLRMQDLIFGLLFFNKRMQIKIVLLGLVIGFVPQLLSWQSLYGNMFNPYLTGGEGFSLFSLQISRVLFSLQNGLFLWTPLFAIGLFGLVLQYKKNIYLLLIFLLQLIIVASWSSPHQGASFSGRMFVSYLPIIGIGLAQIISRLKTFTFISPVLPLFALSFVFLQQVLIIFFLLHH